MSDDPASAPAFALKLDGRTTVLAIIGDPVAQVKAVLPLTRLLQQRGLNTVMVPLHVAAVDVPALLEVLLRIGNFAGLIVTVPHKQLAARLVGAKTAAAADAEAVNVVRKVDGHWHADLLDGVGFLGGLEAAGFHARGRSASIAGAGGAGNAIAFALAAAGAASIGIHDVDGTRKAALIARLQKLGHPAHPWDGATPADLLVNATPLGMRAGDALPLAPAAIGPGTTVAEVIMEPATTPLLALAKERGARIVPGRGMMDHQFERMADFFAEAVRAATAA